MGLIIILYLVIIIGEITIIANLIKSLAYLDNSLTVSVRLTPIKSQTGSKIILIVALKGP